MLKSKTIDRVCCLALAVMILLTAAVWVGKASAGRRSTIEVGYEGLFDQNVVHTIDIEISDWEGFIASAGSEEYVQCNVVIDGERFNNVAVRAKGNTSLSSVTTMGSEKYSFKIEFNHYNKGMLYKGLDKLSLNNLIYDATMMKDYLAYTLMGKMGVPSPLCSFVEITVNGEKWGLYLAAEGVEDGFMERNNMTRGELYKPDSLSFGGGRGNGRDFDFENFRVKDDDEASEANGVDNVDAQPAQPSSGGFERFSFGGGMPRQGEDFSEFGGQFPGGMTMPSGGSMPFGEFSGTTPPTGSESMTLPEGFPSMQPSTEGSGAEDGKGGFTFSMPNFGGNFNFGMGSSDVKLAYIDDDPDSYSNIFDNAKTDISKKDQTRLIEALKKLSNREDLEATVNTDEVIRYLAVHDFLQNSDSYTGMMVHNYYLYEENGQLSIIPWDYNLAFGGMSSTDGTSLVNSPIDSPVTSGNTSDRPLIAWIFEDDEALEQYHTVYGQFIAEVIESGWLEAEITRVAEMIRPYVEKDPNSFFSVEEFDAAVVELQEYCSLRAESIRKQLNGAIPSTSAGQRGNSAALVDGSGLDVSAMGTMGSGGGFGGNFGGGNDRSRMSSLSDPPAGDSEAQNGEAAQNTVKGGAFPGGTIPGDFSGSFSGASLPNGPGGSMPQGTAPDGFTGSFSGGTAPSGFSGSFPGVTVPENSTGTFEGEKTQQSPPGASQTQEKAADGDREENREQATDAKPESAGSFTRKDASSDRKMPSGDVAPFGMQDSSANSITWWELGIYVLVLLLAVALLMKIPGHNK